MKKPDSFAPLLLVLVSFFFMHINSYAQNVNYVSNRAPLVNTPFVSLPLGSVKADGWLLTQLQTQKTGQTGLAESLYPNEIGENSAWLGGKAENSDWEEVPYYVKGLVALAYVLDDAELKQKAQKYIDWVLTSQKPDGSFGPPTNNDWWPRMLVVYYLRDYYEATQDARVVPFLQSYFKLQANQVATWEGKDWPKARMGDNIEIVLWLYNITGEKWLIDLATRLQAKAYNWTDIFTNNRFYDFGNDFHPHHNVNVAQAFKMPAVYYQKSKDETDRNAIHKGLDYLLRERGRVDGMFAGEEFLDHSFSTNGIELCGVVEQMLSDEVALKILGDASLGDHLEKIAYNALPAHLSKTYKQHCYYQYPNQVISKTGKGHPTFTQDYENAIVPSPYSGFPCCRFNWHMGWPYLVKHMWMATADNGLAVAAYGPSTVRAKVANNVSVTIREETNYPFDETIRLIISTPQSVSFPLKLRVPAWCRTPSVSVGGKAQTGVVSGEFYTINRKWKNKEVVEISFPAELKTSTWAANSVGIERGPLVYALQIKEDWQLKKAYWNGFDEFEVLPTSAWNYGLVLDRHAPEKSLKVAKGTVSTQPFEAAPIWITAQARKIPSWGLVANGLYAQEPPASPAASNEPTETVTLIPYGTRHLRVSNFPVIGGGTVYEAEKAFVNHADASRTSDFASAQGYVGGIDFEDSYVEFRNVNVPTAGLYTLVVSFANGMQKDGYHQLVVNGESPIPIQYPTTSGWGKFQILTKRIALKEGNNILKLSKGNSPAELDFISIEKSKG